MTETFYDESGNELMVVVNTGPNKIGVSCLFPIDEWDDYKDTPVYSEYGSQGRINAFFHLYAKEISGVTFGDVDGDMIAAAYVRQPKIKKFTAQ